jgi:hypothetical protein
MAVAEELEAAAVEREIAELIHETRQGPPSRPRERDWLLSIARTELEYKQILL